MSQQWFYTRDGKTTFGPVSSPELQALARSGQLVSTDLVCKQGMSQWTPAGSIKGLPFFNTMPKPSTATPKLARTTLEPTPQPEVMPSSPLLFTGPLPNSQATGTDTAAAVLTMNRLSLALAVLLSLFAAVCALLRVGGELLGPILAGLAILSGFVAVALALSDRKRFVYLGSAATAVFLGLATLLFSIGSIIADKTISEARLDVSRAAETREDRHKAEQAWAKAEQQREQAKAVRDAAVAEPKRILDQVQQERANISKERDDLARKQADNSREEKDLASKREEVRQEQEKLDNRQQGLKLLQSNLAKREETLKYETDRLAPREEKLKLEMQNLAKLEMEAAANRKKAEEAETSSKTLLEQARKIEREAQELYNKFKIEYQQLTKLLKTAKGEDRGRVVSALAQIGPVPKLANVDSQDIHADLCYIALSDLNMRLPALKALDKLEPTFGELVRTLSRPPKDKKAKKSEEDYLDGIKALPTFGRAAVPLKDWLLKRSGYSSEVSNKTDLKNASKLLVDEDPAIKSYLRLLDGINTSRVLSFVDQQIVKDFIARHPRTLIAEEASKLLPKPKS